MPLFVGIGGPSCAGKSSLAQRLLAHLPEQASLLALDWYYNDLSALDEPARAAINFDHPEALDWERLFDDFMLLEAGETIQAPTYDFVRHLRTPETQRVEPRPVVIVEGLHALWQPALRALLDYRIYVDAAQTVCLSRRVARDTSERGRTAAYAVRQFRNFTNPMFLEFIAPTKQHADIVVNGEEDFDMHAAKLAQRLL